MIKIKVDVKNEETGFVTLWLDGESQIIHEGRLVGGSDCCMIKALNLRKNIPFAAMEITREAMHIVKGVPGFFTII